MLTKPRLRPRNNYAMTASLYWYRWIDITIYAAQIWKKKHDTFGDIDSFCETETGGFTAVIK